MSLNTKIYKEKQGSLSGNKGKEKTGDTLDK